MFVDGGSVEARQGPIVAWEMGGYPIDNDADACFVERIDEKLKIFWRSVPAGGRIESGDLVSPGGIKSMLGDGHEFVVGEGHFFEVIDQRLGKLAIAERFAD